jgi:hypothetical protein
LLLSIVHRAEVPALSWVVQRRRCWQHCVGQQQWRLHLRLLSATWPTPSSPKL